MNQRSTRQEVLNVDPPREAIRFFPGFALLTLLENIQPRRTMTMDATHSASSDGTIVHRNGWLIVALLCALYVFSMIDRQILLLLIEPLKARFKLGDVQIGMLVGTAFAIVYACLGIPAARIVDRGNRKWLIVAGVLIWCCSTAASGFATTYLALVLLRLGLAAGEAVLSPATHSMIGDVLPAQKRGLAASIFTAAGIVGGSLSFSCGALVIQALDRVVDHGGPAGFEVWQLTLIAVSVPAFLLGLLFVIAVREPARSTVGAADASGRLVVRQLASRKRLYSGLMLGTALAAGASYAINYWGIETLRRDFGWSAVQAGSAMGPAILCAGIFGSLLVPWISRRLRARGRMNAVVVVNMACTVVTILTLAIALAQSSPWVWLALLGLAATTASGSATNTIAAMQDVAPAPMRGTFVALLIMSISLFGGGVVPILVPWAGNIVAPLGGTLSQALVYVAVACSLAAMALFWWISDGYGREARLGFPIVGAQPE